MIRCLACALLACVLSASPDGLSIQFANPVAAQSYQMKRSAFVFRTMGCADNAKAEVSATAEGKVDGQRRSVTLKVHTAQAAHNVFGIFKEWPSQGVWVVSVNARCAGRTAGALVSTDEKGIVRDSSRALDHPATETEIQAALK